MRMKLFLPLLSVAFVACAATAGQAGTPVTFDRHEGSLSILAGGKPLATYVWQDRDILRPYFARLYGPNGIQLTRNLPAVEGQDPTDHATMHPGLWLAFGDISGVDFWRNKAAVTHVEFVEPPMSKDGSGSFAVRSRYASGEKVICEEVCRIRVDSLPIGHLITWESRFSGPDDFYFGDQEEMGLGIRVASPIAVKKGGELANSDRLKGEKQVWGQQADWCLYGGSIDGQNVGLLLMPDPGNFRRSWFHARDYGLLVANPFGLNAFTKGPKSKIVVKKGETLRLRFGLLVYSGAIDPAAAYQQWLSTLSQKN